MTKGFEETLFDTIGEADEFEQTQRREGQPCEGNERYGEEAFSEYTGYHKI
jgi:hypothetical protein